MKSSSGIGVIAAFIPRPASLSVSAQMYGIGIGRRHNVEAYIYSLQGYGMPLVLLFGNYRYLQIFEDISNSFTE